MTGGEVHIIKIGEVIRLPSTNRKVSTPMLATVEEYIFGKNIKHYIDILREATKGRYNLMKTNGIIRQPTLSLFNTFTGPSEKELIGISDGNPIVGKSFTINNSSWHTSEVIEIIDENIIITRNSVYLLLNKSIDRDKKLKNLGI